MAIKIKIGTEEYTVDGAASEDTLKRIETILKKATGQNGMLDPKYIKSVNDGFKDMGDHASNLDETFDDLVNSSGGLDTTFEGMIKREAARQRTADQNMAQYLSGIKYSSIAFGSSMIDGAKSITKTLANTFAGERGPTALIGALSDVIDKTLTVIADGIKAVASAIPFLGGLIGGLTEAGVGLLKFLNDFLSNQLQRIITDYSKIGDSGVILARGLSDLQKYANNAGISMSDFADALVANQKHIQDTGLGMTLGAQKFSQAITEVTKGADQTSKKMFEMGFSFADQAEIVAASMGNLARTTDIQRVNAQTIAKDSLEYAKNLRIISDITGENAKQQIDEQRKASLQLAVQAKLATMGTDAQEKFRAELSAIPESLRTAFIQKLTLGTVVDTQSNIFLTQNKAASQAIDSAVTNLSDSSLTVAGATKKVLESFAVAQKELVSGNNISPILSAIAIAGVGGVAGAAGTFVDKIDSELVRYSKDGIEKAIKAQTELVNHTDPLTANVAQLNVTMMSFNATIENLAIGAVTTYSNILVKEAGLIETAFTKAINALGSISGMISGGKESTTNNGIKYDFTGGHNLDQLVHPDPEFKNYLKSETSSRWEAVKKVFADTFGFGGGNSTVDQGGTPSMFNMPNMGNSTSTPDGRSYMSDFNVNAQVNAGSPDKETAISNDEKTIAMLQNLVDATNDNNEYTKHLLKIMSNHGGLLQDVVDKVSDTNTIADKTYRNSY